MDTVVYVDKQRRPRSDINDAHADLGLHCSHMTYIRALFPPCASNDIAIFSVLQKDWSGMLENIPYNTLQKHAYSNILRISPQKKLKTFR